MCFESLLILGPYGVVKSALQRTFSRQRCLRRSCDIVLGKDALQPPGRVFAPVLPAAPHVCATSQTTDGHRSVGRGCHLACEHRLAGRDQAFPYSNGCSTSTICEVYLSDTDLILRSSSTDWITPCAKLGG